MKYIDEKKNQPVEGELRCEELNHYLEKLKVPKIVWLSEDGSGIIQKAVFDVKTNQIVGPLLPINSSTGMPKTRSFIARTITDIEKFMKLDLSNLVYIVMAQPILSKSAPFILQIFGINNKFTAQNVMDRWKTTIIELKK